MTLEHVLTMQLGLDWNEGDPPYSSPDNQWNRFYFNEHDFAKALLDLPVVADPGTVFAYNTAATVSLGQAVENAVPLMLDDFGISELMLPLGITDIEVTRTADRPCQWRRRVLPAHPRCGQVRPATAERWHLERRTHRQQRLADGIRDAADRDDLEGPGAVGVAGLGLRIPVVDRLLRARRHGCRHLCRLGIRRTMGHRDAVAGPRGCHQLEWLRRVATRRSTRRMRLSGSIFCPPCSNGINGNRLSGLTRFIANAVNIFRSQLLTKCR